jgi:hypothetical protein
MEANFATEISDVLGCQEITGEECTILCYTDGYKKDEQVGAGVYITDNVTSPREEL